MKLLLPFTAALALCPLVNAGVGYLRPEVSAVMPTDSEADGTFGLSIAGGVEFGEAGRHAVELELGWAEWDLSSTVMGVAAQIEGTHKVTPVLVNYRFSTRLGEKLHGYIHAGAGFAKSEIEWTDAAMGGYDDTGLAYAVGIGLRWQFADRAALTAGYRYLTVDTLEWRFSWDEGEGVEGFEILSNDSDAHMISLGVHLSF